MRLGQISKAAKALRRLTDQFPDSDGFTLLARAEEVSGRSDAALEAINRAIELSPYFSYDAERMRARLLATRGECADSVRNMLAIRERMPLSDADQVLLARCRYETDRAVFGRALLKDLLSKRRPPIEATLLFARRHGDDPQDANLARRELEAFVRGNPTHWEALRELIRLDVAANRGPVALARLDRIVMANLDAAPGHVRLLRARLSADQGREEGTLEEAQAAFELTPQLKGALELVVALQIREGDVDAATAAAEEAQRAGAFDDSRRLLLGQLYRMAGREQDALSVFEKAIARGTEDPTLYYQMGLALRSLERGEEAAQAFEKALSISTSFPEASDARRALEGARSAGAS
jgi:tetratricopeptide (TPR) repeat protein